ncbi:MAG: PH domain-containing protein [Candidatus Thorarchaeota archaeon]|jgi:membrane protein YdbS with pleckstrin-like domain
MTEEDQIPAEDREKLLATFHPARTGFLYLYVLGAVFFLIGWLFNISVAAGVIQYDELAWWLGMAGMLFALILWAIGEYKKRYTVYVVTTWNLRVMKGSYKRMTTRVFFDEIDKFEIDATPQTRVINLGALRVYTKEDSELPALEFVDIHNPEGMLELVNRIKLTTPNPIPWAHVEKTRIVRY